MDYCIKNNKNVYLKLNEKGTPVTCVGSVKGVFEFSKAKNILGSLPKTLKRLNFQVEPIPEIPTKKEKTSEKKSIQSNTYVVTENISRWIDKFGTCADILNEAKEREIELIKELEESDKELLDILHIIEIENSKDMFSGWKIYKSIRDNRKQRRNIKDEIIIVENVLREINPSSIQRERVQKAVEGLIGRKYRFRIVEEEENAVM